MKWIYGIIGVLYIWYGHKKTGAVFGREHPTKRTGSGIFAPVDGPGAGQTAGQKSPRLPRPWRRQFRAFPCIGKTETEIVVAITGRVVVAIRCTAILRVVVPRPAAIDTVGA